MTTIDCASASGVVLPPLCILKGIAGFNSRNLPNKVDRGLIDTWRRTTSTKGWPSDYLAQGWLNELFLPETQHLEGRLLILDSHGSHIKAQFVATCIHHDVDLMILPSHTSHKMQPLDVGIIQPLKKAMARMTDHTAQQSSGSVPQWVWITIPALARKQAFTSANILVG